jgi:ATP-dependent DNA ligase
VIRRLLELDGEDLRRMPIETRKLTLKSLLSGKHAWIGGASSSAMLMGRPSLGVAIRQCAAI